MLKTFIRGLTLGAGAMFFFDPARGRTRRAMARDWCLHWSHRTNRFLDKALRDAENRIRGTAAELNALFHFERVPDQVLVQRVRSRIGRCLSHPHALSVSADRGRIVLAGRVFKEELPGLLAAVWRVRGVRNVEDHTNGEEGHFTRQGRMTLGHAWAPSTRLFLGGVGACLMLNCVARNTLGAKALGTAGFGLFLASMSHCEESTTPRSLPAEVRGNGFGGQPGATHRVDGPSMRPR